MGLLDCDWLCHWPTHHVTIITKENSNSNTRWAQGELQPHEETIREAHARYSVAGGRRWWTLLQSKPKQEFREPIDIGVGFDKSAHDPTVFSSQRRWAFCADAPPRHNGCRACKSADGKGTSNENIEIYEIGWLLILSPLLGFPEGVILPSYPNRALGAYISMQKREIALLRKQLFFVQVSECILFIQPILRRVNRNGMRQVFAAPI